MANDVLSADASALASARERGRLRVVFMGTPEFALGSLHALAASPVIEIALVVTRPDACSGRGKALLPSAVKSAATALHLPVLETKTLRSPEIQQVLRDQHADVFCVAAFGAILPPEVLQMPPLGCLNVHASLLPQGRGAAPMQRGLLEGEQNLGFSIMRIEEGLDTGPYCLQDSVPVEERCFCEIAGDLSERGGAALVHVLTQMFEGTSPVWIEQDDAAATHADKIDKRELLLDPCVDAVTNRCRVQASGDAAPARCLIGGRRVRVEQAHVLSEQEVCECDVAELPGQAEVRVVHGRLLLGCESGVLEVLCVRPDGKRSMNAHDFAAGLRGDHLIWEAL